MLEPAYLKGLSPHATEVFERFTGLCGPARGVLLHGLPLAIFRRGSSLCGAPVWARRALNSKKMAVSGPGRYGPYIEAAQAEAAGKGTSSVAVGRSAKL
jgi:hypothetical protein